MTNGLATCKCAADKVLKNDYSACAACGDKATCDGTMTFTCKDAGWIPLTD
jgi:hypothetical protein